MTWPGLTISLSVSLPSQRQIALVQGAHEVDRQIFAARVADDHLLLEFDRCCRGGEEEELPHAGVSLLWHWSAWVVHLARRRRGAVALVGGSAGWRGCRRCWCADGCRGAALNC